MSSVGAIENVLTKPRSWGLTEDCLDDQKKMTKFDL